MARPEARTTESGGVRSSRGGATHSLGLPSEQHGEQRPSQATATRCPSHRTSRGTACGPAGWAAPDTRRWPASDFPRGSTGGPRWASTRQVARDQGAAAVPRDSPPRGLPWEAPARPDNRRVAERLQPGVHRPVRWRDGRRRAPEQSARLRSLVPGSGVFAQTGSADEVESIGHRPKRFRDVFALANHSPPALGRG